MAALPDGDEGSVGVTSIEACVRIFHRVPELTQNELKQRAGMLQRYADDLTQLCDPRQNPTSFSSCQASAEGAVPGLLHTAQLVPKIEARVAAYVALARISFGCVQTASCVATCEQLLPTVEEALRPISEIIQQQECISCLQMLQALAAVVPEAPAVRGCLPKVAALMAGEREGHAPCRALRFVAMEVLVSCAHSSQLRKQVGNLLPMSALALLSADADQGSASESFTFSLLLASLSDLEVPANENAVTEESVLQTFGQYAQGIWDRIDFFGELANCLSASLRRDQWPPESGIYHTPWKLAGTCMRLALAGHAQNLDRAAAPLVATVERRISSAVQGDDATTEVQDADAARAARLAAVALRELLQCGLAETATREKPCFLEALKLMQSEEPAAADLIQILQQSSQGSDLQYSVDTSPPF